MQIGWLKTWFMTRYCMVDMPNISISKEFGVLPNLRYKVNMPRRNRTRARRNRRGGNQKVVSTLKRIEDNTRMDREGPPPMTRDKLPMTLSNRKIYTFKRSAIGTSISVSTAASTFGAASYYLASFDPTSEFAENFQLYRIIELTVHFIPTAEFVNTIGASGNAVVNMGVFSTVIDVHNDTTPISTAELEQYKTYQQVMTGKYISRTWTPRTLGRAYAGVTDGFYAMPVGTWLSTDYNDVNYYGIKWSLGQSVSTGNPAIYTTRVEAVIQCKNTL